MERDLIQVLLVEDNPGDARLLHVMLADVAPNQFHLTHVERLGHARQSLAERRFEIVLLDLSLPDSQGLDTFARMYEQAPHVPIILLTGLDDEAVAMKAVREGAQDYLVKGQIDGNLLMRAMRYAIERKRSQEEIRRRTAHLEALNTIIAAGVAAPDLSELLETALDLTLEAMGLEMGASWVAGDLALRGLPTDIAQAIGLDLPLPSFVEGVEDQVMPSFHETWNDILARYTIHANLVVPILLEGQPIGGLGVAANEARTWSPDEVALVGAVGRQLGAASERLRLLTESREHARRVEQIIGTVPEGVALLDADLRVLSTNPAAQYYLDMLTGAQQGGVLAYLGRRPVAELLTPPRSGLWHQVETDSSPPRVFEALGRPMQAGDEAQGWVLVIRDVTTEREIQQAVQRQDRLAALGRLAASIAHELKDPLQAIQNSLTLVEEELAAGQRPDKLTRYVGIIDSEFGRIAAVVGRMLGYFRPAGEGQRAVDVHQVLESVLGLASEQLHRSQVTVKRHWGQELPRIYANPDQLEQAFLDLVLHAIDAMPGGGTLRISTALDHIRRQRVGDPSARVSPTEAVRVDFGDTGPGMSSETQSRLFEPFFTPGQQGAGLGLFISYGIIEAHSGQINVDSQQGVGTTFTVLLPVNAAPLAR